MAEPQVIPARHGTATFVPAGQVIKIINTSGSQVIDTWAFALPKPEPKSEEKQDAQQQQAQGESEKQNANASKPAAATKQTPAKTKKKMDLPSQEDAEKATQEAWKEGEEAQPEKSTWGSYLPSTSSYLPSKIWSSSKQDGSKDSSAETEQQKDSKTWSSYFPSGKGYSNYIPGAAKEGVSNFASMHARDPNKSYMQQLQDFSRTPVGAAGWSALTGSGWGGSTFAGYQAYAQSAANSAPMEYMSMMHTRAATLHMRPRVDDTFVSNLREPIMTLIEDSSSGIHDTLIAACDPARYKGLGVDNWQEHGSCAENLVLALGELNKRAGLKGAKGVGADVTINSVPAPLNLFMNIPWDDDGDISFDKPKCKKEAYVRFKAERDIVVVMSACPQDILDINNKKPTDAHFLVEGEEDTAPAIKRTGVRKRPPPRKVSSSHATSTVGTETNAPTSQRAPAQRKTVPQKRPQATGATPAPSAAPKAAASKPAASTQPAKKKPIPAAVNPQKKTTATPTPTPAAKSSAPPAAEKKKPRKLNAKKAEA